MFVLPDRSLGISVWIAEVVAIVGITGDGEVDRFFSSSSIGLEIIDWSLLLITATIKSNKMLVLIVAIANALLLVFIFILFIYLPLLPIQGGVIPNFSWKSTHGAT